MREREAAPGARHALRLRDLRGRTDLVAVYSACRHSTPVWLRQLVKGRSKHRRLVEAEVRPQCQRCGNRDGYMVQVPGVELEYGPSDPEAACSPCTIGELCTSFRGETGVLEQASIHEALPLVWRADQLAYDLQPSTPYVRACL